jgi:hypothetical protein
MNDQKCYAIRQEDSFFAIFRNFSGNPNFLPLVTFLFCPFTRYF